MTVWVLFALKCHGESKRWHDQSTGKALGAFPMLTGKYRGLFTTYLQR